MAYYGLQSGAETMTVYEQTMEEAKNFDPEKAVVFLTSVAKKDVTLYQLQRCFPEKMRYKRDDTEEIRKKKRKAQLNYLHLKAGSHQVVLPKRVQDVWMKGRANLKSGHAASSISRDGQNVRMNLYKFAGALGYDAEQTRELFAKTAGLAPWKRKIWRELCYYFYVSQNDKAWYHKGEKMIHEIEMETAGRCAEKKPLEPSIRETVIIDTGLQEIQNDSEDSEALFKQYILENWSTFQPENYNHTAHELVKNLCKRCEPYVWDELVTLKCSGRDIRKDAWRIEDGEVRYEIYVKYFYLVMIGEREGNVLLTEFLQAEDGSLLKNIGLNCKKQYENLSDVIKGDHIDDGKLRRLVILLEFYLFYSKLSKVQNVKDPFELFWDEMNAILFHAGFSPLYSRDPYDCLFLLAARSEHPIENLREMILKAAKKYESEIKK
ncbi:MAG: hypothetical protein Q4F28_04595 [Eubacteriales bacterium]|nr:hypothetical protein [Eubacteriales bacterium]